MKILQVQRLHRGCCNQRSTYQLHRLSYTICYPSKCYNDPCGTKGLNKSHEATQGSAIRVQTCRGAICQVHAVLGNSNEALRHVWRGARKCIESWITFWGNCPTKVVCSRFVDSLDCLTPVNPLNGVAMWNDRRPIAIAEVVLPNAIWRWYGRGTWRHAQCSSKKIQACVRREYAAIIESWRIVVRTGDILRYVLPYRCV